MRLMLKFTANHETFNALLKNGKAADKIRKILEEQKPEAAYFTAMDGRRCAIIVIDVPEASNIPRFVEPWLLTFNGDVETYPVMTAQDLATSGLAEIAKKLFAEA